MRYHLCLCISGALKNRKLLKCFTDGNGNPIPESKARDHLKLLQANGARVMKMDDCDNFDDQTGCKGHE